MTWAHEDRNHGFVKEGPERQCNNDYLFVASHEDLDRAVLWEAVAEVATLGRPAVAGTLASSATFERVCVKD